MFCGHEPGAKKFEQAKPNYQRNGEKVKTKSKKFALCKANVWPFWECCKFCSIKPLSSSSGSVSTDTARGIFFQASQNVCYVSVGFEFGSIEYDHSNLEVFVLAELFIQYDHS